MTLIKTACLVSPPISGLIAANPTKSDNVKPRDLFEVSLDLSKQTLFNVEDIKSDQRKEFLQEAQKEAVDIAGVPLKMARRGVEDNVRGGLTDFVGNNVNEEGTVVLGDVRVWDDDYLRRDPKYCDQVKNGKSPTAYYSRTRKGGFGPSMHYCDKFFDRKSKAEYLANNCVFVASHIDTGTTTSQHRGANVLHEFDVDD
ncbi:hypothetical protein yc1106_00463 [Curvularia clavata]|uniref:Uncharacterized protein n=1 Tax=Curvularia clavata TaxID=95742 RepID=A0A9Q8Z1N4_CURCL|nr:hypothetical protein yc1106_00463 [Curvularia clavata]